MKKHNFLAETKCQSGKDSGCRPASRAWLALLWVALLALGLTGCRNLPSVSSSSKPLLGSLGTGTNLNSQTEGPTMLQDQAMRFADNYTFTVAQAVDDYTLLPISKEARTEAMRWKLAQGTAAYVDASGADPMLNGLDLLVLATLSRMVMEDEITRVFGPEGSLLLEAQRRLETNAWNWAQRVLKPEQQQELRGFIQEWREKNPGQRYVAVTRLRELVATVGRKGGATVSAPGSILGLLYLDPFAGLDPTTAAIEESRQTAERAMYYMQRMPMLLNWQVQLATIELTAQPETKRLLDNADRLTRSTEAFADLANQMPKLVNDQREAAIEQVLAGLANERTNWLAVLNSAQVETSALLGETRQTLNAAGDAANAVNGSIKSLDAFVRYVSPPQTNQLITPTNQHPFDVRDYGTAASQLGIAAQELNTLLLTLNQSAPALSREISANTQAAVNHAFWLGLVLLISLLVGLLLVGWICCAWRRTNCQAAIAAPTSQEPNKQET